MAKIKAVVNPLTRAPIYQTRQTGKNQSNVPVAKVPAIRNGYARQK